MSEKKQTVDLGLLEEDDEFEEFPAEGELRRQHFMSQYHYASIVAICFLSEVGYATVTQLA